MIKVTTRAVNIWSTSWLYINYNVYGLRKKINFYENERKKI